ncbi:GGDEF domain-containing protein [Bacillus massilinigeriensis]|uniref:GGDEF domain-containing protein n=1 Tax=Bacillus massilionigeriensis TaxID=1805475 RepID=UPI00096B2440|nr:GGDEF domain-containing protein [Bacillus massilionigeriensis]
MKNLLEKIGSDASAIISIFDYMIDLVFLMEKEDDSFRYVFVNQSAKRVLNIKEDIEGRRIEEILSMEHAKSLIEKYKQVLVTKEPLSFTETLEMETGETFTGETTLSPIKTEDGACIYVMAIVRDTTERKKMRDELARMAYYDYLSGLPNRRTFDERLQMSIHQAELSKKMVALLMLDGRKFKKINDTYGHDAGDFVIQEMAVRIQKCVRKTDTVARLGGDELAVILPEIDSVEEAEVIAKRILKSFDEPVIFNCFEIEMGAGIGIAIYPDHSVDQKQLVKNADIALYEAKKVNANQFCVFGFGACGR